MRALIERYFACYNAFDLAGMVSLLSANVFFEHFSSGELTAATQGKLEFAALAERAAGLFLEREQTITAFDASGNVVRVGIAFHGVCAVMGPNGAQPGSVIDLSGSSEFTFDGVWIGSIVDRR